MNFFDWLLLREINEEEGFFKTIRNEPSELTNWLVYADWLDENNDPRGSLVRGFLNKSDSRALAQVDGVWADSIRYNQQFIFLLSHSFPLARYTLGFNYRGRIISLSETKKVIEIIKGSGKKPPEVMESLTEISPIIRGNGINDIQIGTSKKEWGHIVALYVNMTHNYDQTVIFDVDNMRYLITSVGDYIGRRNWII